MRARALLLAIALAAGPAAADDLLRGTRRVLAPGASVTLDCGKSQANALTPGEDETITATGHRAGVSCFLFVQSTATSRTLTFGSGFAADVEDLVTGTDTAVVHKLHFVSDGSVLRELPRTGGGGGGSGDVESVQITTTSPLTGSATCSTGACAFTLGLGIVPASLGGLGADASASSGFVLFTAGVTSFVASTGTGNVVRASAPTIDSPTVTTSLTLGADDAYITSAQGTTLLGLDDTSILTVPAANTMVAPTTADIPLRIGAFGVGQTGNLTTWDDNDVPTPLVLAYVSPTGEMHAPVFRAIRQASSPAAPANGFKLFADASDRVAWRDPSGTHYIAPGTSDAACWDASGNLVAGGCGGGAGDVTDVNITTTANELSGGTTCASGACSFTLGLASIVNLTAKTLRVPNSTTLPATCTVGDAYQDNDATATSQWYLCTATNTWTAQGGGGSGTVTSISAGAGITLTPNPITTTGTISVSGGAVDMAVVTATYTGDSSTTAFTLPWTPALNGVISANVGGQTRAPSTYSVSGTTFTIPLSGPAITTGITITLTAFTALPLSATGTKIDSFSCSGGTDFTLTETPLTGGFIKVSLGRDLSTTQWSLIGATTLRLVTACPTGVTVVASYLY